MWNQRMYPNFCSTNLDTNPDISESGAELEDGDLESSKDLINHVCDYRHLASDSNASTSGLFFEKKIHSFKGYNIKFFQRNNADQIIQSHGKKNTWKLYPEKPVTIVDYAVWKNPNY